MFDFIAVWRNHYLQDNEIPEQGFFKGLLSVHWIFRSEFTTGVAGQRRNMQILENHPRVRCIFKVVGAGLLLFHFIGGSAFAVSSPKIETMAQAELNQLVSNDQGISLLFFTAAWCGHCKEMLPTLNRLYHRFHDKGLRFTGISIDAGGPAAMERVLEKKQVDFSVFWVGETVVDEFRLVGIPMIFLVKNGQIVEKIPGKCSYEFLQGKILDFIK